MTRQDLINEFYDRIHATDKPEVRVSEMFIEMTTRETAGWWFYSQDFLNHKKTFPFFVLESGGFSEKFLEVNQIIQSTLSEESK